jgi:hypothetical protein
MDVTAIELRRPLMTASETYRHSDTIARRFAGANSFARMPSKRLRESLSKWRDPHRTFDGGGGRSLAEQENEDF